MKTFLKNYNFSLFAKCFFVLVLFTPTLAWSAGTCSNPGYNASKMLCEAVGATWTEDGSKDCSVNGQIYENVDTAECNRLKQEAQDLKDKQNKDKTTTDKGSSYIPNLPDKASIADYIKAIYTYAIGVVGILSTVVIMIGGLIWITSMGNASRVNSAKEWIGAALTGLALAMFSYTILYVINRDLVNFKWTAPQPIETGSKTGEDNKNSSNCDPTCTADQECKKKTGGRNNDWSCQPKQTSLNQEGCPDYLSPDDCKACDDCKQLEVPTKDGAYANSAMANKLKNAYDNSDKNWRVTEAWPPVVSHSNPGHKDGNAVDLNFTNNATPADVANLNNSLKNSGLNPVYELGSNGDCSPYTSLGVSCESYSDNRSTHFHVTQ